MNYLITAAGKGSRFKKEGLYTPKPLIKVFDNELLIWSLKSFNLSSKDKVFITTYIKHQARKKLEKKINNLYPKVQIFWLELREIPSGQLLTALKTIDYFNIEGAIVIHNCDTFYDFEISEINKLLETNIFGIIPCFKSKGDHWSFAKSSINDESLAIEVKEKVRISENCSVGTYIFNSAESLIFLCNEYFKNNDFEGKPEYYIAPIYQYAIDKKMKVKITKAKNVKVFGTPKELLLSFGISNETLFSENI